MKSTIALTPLLAACLLATAPASADLIHLKDGRILDGAVVREEVDAIVVELRQGSVTGQMRLPRAEVLRVVPQDTGWAALEVEYATRRAAALTFNDANEWEDLADWCEDNKLHSQRRDCLERAFRLREAVALVLHTKEDFRRLLAWAQRYELRGTPIEARIARHILTLDPDDALARALLGFVKFEGRWMTPAEREVAYERHIREKGMLEFEGRWYTPEALEAYAKVIQAERAQRELARLEREHAALEAEVRDLEAELFWNPRRGLNLSYWGIQPWHTQRWGPQRRGASWSVGRRGGRASRSWAPQRRRDDGDSVAAGNTRARQAAAVIIEREAGRRRGRRP